MIDLQKPRDIIDRRALVTELGRIAPDSKSGRAALVELI